MSKEPKKNHWYEMYELECLKTKELEAQIEKMSELINRYYMVCAEIPKELRTMVFDSCLEDTRKMVKDKEIKEK